jgi:TatA/E family protein of Tat protein translocase
MNIFGLGPMEILLIVVLALIVFGPAKLPEIMGQVGKAIADFRRATSSLSDEFNRTIQAELQETKSIVADTKSAVTGSYADINAAISGATAAATLTTPAPALTTAAPANGVSNGTNGTNGTALTPRPLPEVEGAAAEPPPAATSQWSWETAAPAPAKPAVDIVTSEPAASSQPAAAASPAPSPAQPSTSRKNSRRDDLLPPY